MALIAFGAIGDRLVARPLYSFGNVAIVFGLAALHAKMLAPTPVDLLGSEVLMWWAVLASSLVAASYAVGLPELATSRVSALLRGFVALASSFAVILVAQALLARPLLPRSSSILVAVIVPLWSVIGWNLTNDATARAATRARVLVVAARREDLESLRRDIAEAAERPAQVVGFVAVDGAESHGAGDRTSVIEAALDSDANVVVLDTAAQASTSIVEQAAELHRQGLRIRTMSLFYEEWIGKLPHAELARVSLLFDVGELHRVRYVRFKRVIDLIFGAVGLLALGPLIVAVAAANPLFNRGPVFYRQPRVGKDGVIFTILKLRTMVPGQESAWTAADDARITRLGAALRRTHLDELPQVINIFRGDLSLVGPRPEQPHYVAELTEKIAFFELRQIVRPGLTGWAQVKQGYAADHADAFDKLQYDFYYLRRQGAGLDAKILWRTVRGVLGAQGR